MSDSGLCVKCISGYLHEGTPAGTVREIAGTATYVAPSPATPSDKTIVILTDLFGYKLPNSRLVADEYSRAGYNVIVPDILHDDGMGFDSLKNVKNLTEMFEIVGPWLQNHGPETVIPITDAIFAELRSQKQKIGIVGFCFGGREAFHYAATDKVDVVCTMHPSLINIPADAQKVKKPISIHVAASDEIYDAAKSKEAAEIFEKNKVPYENRIYDGEGVEHGFGIRADLSKAPAKKAKEAAFSATVAWFDKFL
ncbi:protein of unknown function [Taphrina deformans PYCC 5710]|uniref:Dienelactone hydrolase domain-containing protein n=1 Tax=Taphrina deformans (strain PYCC 5710 / ATCC 11124 / CBS 356.35 / IMI 108563 / JCM 9778 / NBRC 8474) TaxID=1097556 RepID=R4XG99_TAPDE|nr:protein of unknown function [Taphrina deformans PYCC 5710]|eukprot:CCG84927.1 protein of unknown function [Taphrina deformans PYCC 5710]